MPKFRKKPVVIEAFQMTKEANHLADKWPVWLVRGFTDRRVRTGKDGMLIISTLEGDHTVSWNDYIIQGVKGELYPCKPDIFEATYDKEL